MHTWQPALTSALLMLGGCAPQYTPPPLSPDHPANPDAVSAPLAERSQTLVIDNAPKPSPPATEGHGMQREKPPVSAPQHQPDAPAADAAVLYVCPMHPEVTADKPDQRCPKCGMKLVKSDTKGGE